MIEADMLNSLQKVFCSIFEIGSTTLTSAIELETRFGARFQTAALERPKNAARRS